MQNEICFDRQVDRQPGRNYGIDALRLISMFMVTVLHTLGHGGALNTAVGLNYNIVWLIEIIAYCAVNCYAIISGFVSYSEIEKPYRYSKYISMWLQVVFYSFGISLITFFISSGNLVGVKGLIKSLLPVVTKRYWYFSAYTALFFIIPWLNFFVRKLNKEEMTRFVLVLFVLFSCLSILVDPFSFNSGYSFGWLAVMYLFGAWLKKCDIINKIKGCYALLVMLICILFTWILKSFLSIGIFVSYLSPTIVIIALCFVVIFAKLDISKAAKTIIGFLSPAAFGVYIIHEHSVIKDNLINDRFLWIAELRWYLVPIAVIVSALCIFTICIVVEKIRLSLFKVLKINRIAENCCIKAESWLKTLWQKYI
ncbi:MAG: acyltransferase family protein [Clostridia bacterium]|nr:acyltransferase family protein [Clostridia bacterium]